MPSVHWGLDELIGEHSKSFVHMPTQSQIVVQDIYLDLEAYIVKFTGHTRLLRLVYVSLVCPNLGVEALPMARIQAMGMKSVTFFKFILDRMNFYEKKYKMEFEKSPSIDTEWINQQTKINHSAESSLKRNLAMRNSTPFKHSVRVGYMNLAYHHYETGNYIESVKCSLCAQEYIEHAEHLINLSSNIFNCLFQLSNFKALRQYIPLVLEIHPMPESNPTPLFKSLKSRLNMMLGISYFVVNDFQKSISLFSQVDVEHMGFSDICNLCEFGHFAGLAAMVSYSYTELRKLLNRPTFERAFEDAVGIRRCVEAYGLGNYQALFVHLNRMYPFLLLDPYIGQKVDLLFYMLRQRIYIDYMYPFTRINLQRMCELFQIPCNKLMEELKSLISDINLDWVIDENKCFAFSTIMYPNYMPCRGRNRQRSNRSQQHQLNEAQGDNTQIASTWKPQYTAENQQLGDGDGDAADANQGGVSTLPNTIAELDRNLFMQNWLSEQLNSNSAEYDADIDFGLPSKIVIP